MEPKEIEFTEKNIEESTVYSSFLKTIKSNNLNWLPSDSNQPTLSLKPQPGVNYQSGVSNINYPLKKGDILQHKLTNEDRINAIIADMTELKDKVDALNKTARELISDMRSEKHERRTLSK